MSPLGPTPEERLFKIIQEGEKTADPAGAAATGPAPASPKAAAPAAEPVVSEKDVREKKAARAVTAAGPKPGLGGWTARHASLPMLNRVFGGILVASILYGVGDHLMTKNPGEEFLKRSRVDAPLDVAVPPDLFQIRQESIQLPARNVFRPYSESEAAPAPAAPGPAAPPAGALAALSRFKLTGIFVADPPEALVETTDENKTYAVRSGTQVRGLTVKAVKPEGVVFTDGSNEQLLK